MRPQADPFFERKRVASAGMFHTQFGFHGIASICYPAPFILALQEGCAAGRRVMGA
jgi:hypothetical protein